MAKFITVMGNDPGKNNYAWAVVRVKLDEPEKFKILATGMIENVITDFTSNPRQQASAYRKEMRKIVDRYGVDVVVAERFQNRGRFSGNTGELVSAMIGVIFGLKVLGVMIITAAQWKNAYNRLGDLKALYEESSLVAHRVDAASIALYGAYYYLKQPYFSFIGTHSQRWYRKKLDRTL